MEIKIEKYEDFKALVVSKALGHYSYGKYDRLLLIAIDGPLFFTHVLVRKDLKDYESSLLSSSNKKIGDILNISPFSSKVISGGKLFRRKYGFKSASIPVGESGVITLVVPYSKVKINEIELVNGKEGDTIDFKVLDTATGLLTGVPNYMLNQFAFDAELPNGFYRDRSDYDAELVAGMQIQITYKNNGLVAHTIRGNITYHEVRP